MSRSPNVERWCNAVWTLQEINSDAPLKVQVPFLFTVAALLNRSVTMDFPHLVTSDKKQQTEAFEMLYKQFACLPPQLLLEVCGEGKQLDPGRLKKMDRSAYIEIDEAIIRYIDDNQFSSIVAIPVEWLFSFVLEPCGRRKLTRDALPDPTTISHSHLNRAHGSLASMIQLGCWYGHMEGVAALSGVFARFVELLEESGGFGSRSQFAYEQIMTTWSMALRQIHTKEASRQAIKVQAQLRSYLETQPGREGDVINSYLLESIVAEDAELPEHELHCCEKFLEFTDQRDESTVDDKMQARFHLAAVTLRHRNFEDAVKRSQEAADFANANGGPLEQSQAYYRLAWAYEHVPGHDDDVVRDMKKAVDLLVQNPQFGDDELDGMYSHLSVKAYSRGDFDEAEKLLTLASKFKTRSTHTKYFLECCKAELACFRGDYRKGLDILGQALIAGNQDDNFRQLWNDAFSDAYTFERFLVDDPLRLERFLASCEDPSWDEEFYRSVTLGLRLVSLKNDTKVAVTKKTIQMMRRTGQKTTLPFHIQEFKKTFDCLTEC